MESYSQNLLKFFATSRSQNSRKRGEMLFGGKSSVIPHKDNKKAGSMPAKIIPGAQTAKVPQQPHHGTPLCVSQHHWSFHQTSPVAA